MSAFLQVSGFSCGYGDQFRLEEIDFRIDRGTILGVIGPNGSGKTTLFRGITGELKTGGGEVELNGRKLSEMSHRDKARSIAVVSQHIYATDITVEDYVLTGRMPHRKSYRFFESAEDYRKAHHYMRLTNVFHLKDALLSKTSGGEQQLAAIARALTQEPELLLLDEPTSHLDITHQVEILNLIQRLNEQMNLTVMMIMHDLNLAGEYCEYLLMLNHGKIFKQGTPEEVIDYRVIEKGYDTVVVVRPNPVSGKPAVFLVSEKVLKEQKGKTDTDA